MIYQEMLNPSVVVTNSVLKPQGWPYLTHSLIPNIVFQIVDEWLGLLRRRHREDPGCTVAVHCVAGLGRAPVLVAIALIELGQRYEDAVELIRQ